MTRATTQRMRMQGQLLAWLGLLLLCLVGGRGLVVCDGPHCAARIQFAHGEGSCCGGHDHAAATVAAAAPACGHESCAADGEPATAGHACGGGCRDRALVLETGPLPGRVAVPATSPPASAVIAWLPPRQERDHAPCAVPPPTGPPRTPTRWQQHRTTVLRL